MSASKPSGGRASVHPQSKIGLTPAGIRWRSTCLFGLPPALLGLALVQPDSLPHWFPFATSCGAITGLPCIFCGTTRALHHLLHGDFGTALYYNWLAFPLAAGVSALLLVNTLEVLLGRNLLARAPRIRVTPASLGGLAAGLVLLWCLQAYLAVSQHKTELLNPHGPLYSLVVR